MRTDTQRLDFLLHGIATADEDVMERLNAAVTLGLGGRAMVDAAMGAKVIEPGEPMPALTAIDLATAEIGRIRNVEGFSEEMDDKYVPESGEFIGPLTMAALAYFQRAPSYWPWQAGYFKPSPDDRKKELAKGIALALCELDRLIRAERRASLELQADVCREMNEAACEPEDVQPQPRKFKIGDRVKCNDPCYSFGIGALGTIIEGERGLWGVKVDASGCGSLHFRESELEHVDD